MTNGEIDMVPALVESDKPELGKGMGHICQPVRGQGASVSVPLNFTQGFRK